jgi:hypothetical protein
MELIRRLRYIGYLDQIGITEREAGEVFEKLIDHLAANHDWSRISSASSDGVSTGSDSDRVGRSKKSAKKSSKKSSKSSKSKAALPVPDEIISEPVKLYYLIDRREFLEKVKSVYAAYA